MKIEFTAANLRKLPAGERRKDYLDPRYPSLIFRVERSGNKVWILRLPRTPDGRRPSKTLGSFPAISLKAVVEIYYREKTRLANDEPDEDIDREIREAEAWLLHLKQQAAMALPFEELGSRWIEGYAKKKKKSWKHDAARLENARFETWRGRDVGTIMRSDVVDFLSDWAEDAPVSANRTLSMLRTIFAWGVTEGLVKVNPCLDIAKPGVEQSRDRVLTDNEIVWLWRIFQNTRSKTMRDCLTVLLFTGQRRSEVVGMTWSEIRGSWWNLPQARTKSGRSHRVYLAPTIVELLARRRKLVASRYPDSGSRFVFPAKAKPEQCFDGRAVTRFVYDTSQALIKERRIDSTFTVHDLRRTMATGMASSGVSRQTIRLVLNHSDPSVTAVYDRHHYDPEVEEALTRWASRLLGLFAEDEP